MGFVGAAPSPRVVPSRRLPGVSNYFLGDDPSRWRSGVPHYGSATYRDLWPGVDLVFRGDPSRLEYDLLLAPGADLDAVLLRMDGPSSMDLDGDGNLVLSFEKGEVRQTAPRIYQESRGVRREIAGGFRLLGDGVVGFEAARFDRSLPLVVDPKIDWSTYLGGGGSDYPTDAAVDGSGNVLVVGLTNSTDFPTVSPYQAFYGGGSGSFPDDAFVTKYSSAGNTVVFSTFLGGSGFDDAYGVATDSSGSIYLCGITNSTNFPTASPYQAANGGGYDDAYVVKMSSSGSSLLFSTYLGSGGSDEATEIAVDGTGIYVGGGTTQSGFPLASPLQAVYGGGSWDAVLFKMSLSGATLIYSTLFGGTGLDYSHGMTVDGNGSMYATGVTNSTNFPTKSPFQSAYAGGTGNVPNDAFAVKLNAAGTATVYATYIGGAGYDDCYQIGVNSAGEAYLAGFTASANFPVQSALQPSSGGSDDGYVVKFGSSGSTLAFSTYLGGSGADYVMGLGVDSSGSITACGVTNSTNFPIQNAFPPVYLGGGSPFADDAFVTKLDLTGSNYLYSSYLQSNGFDDAYGMTLDGNGNAVVVGITSSASWNHANPAQASFAGGAYDAYVVRIALVVPAAPTTLAAQAAGSGSVQLTWTDASTNEAAFEVERRSGTGAFAKIAQTTANEVSYSDFAVAPSTTYTYRVRGINGDGGSAYSNEASATTGSIIPAPVSPNALVATPVSPTEVGLTWNDRSNNEVIFEVQRRAVPGTFAPVVSLPPNSTSWSNAGLAADTPYIFRVRAVGLAGPSLWSAEAAATTPPTLTVTAAKGTLTDSSTVARDRVKVSGTFDFLPASPDGALDPLQEGITVLLGAESDPFVVPVGADDAGWKLRKTRATWKSPRGSATKAVLVLDLAKKTFTVTLSKLTFPSAVANPIRLSLRVGADAGSHRLDWTPKPKPGMFKLP